MDEEKVLPNILWRDRKTGKLIRRETEDRLVECWKCPCCEPKVIASKITNAGSGDRIWDLRSYKKENIGIPGAKWRLRDVGESHYNNPNSSCSGSLYGEGWINDKGVLVGLQDVFTSGYYYNEIGRASCRERVSVRV